MNRTHLQRPTSEARVIEFPRIQGVARLEIQDVEARLKELMDFAEGIASAPFSLFLEANRSVRQAIEELIVKVNALDWIMRVAKRSTGRVRESLWADIERALVGLEETAELLIRTEEEWAQSSWAGRRERMV